MDDAKCTVVTRVCVSVYLSAAACPHYCMDPDVTWRSGRGCPLVVHCCADFQSVHGFRGYDNIHVCKLIALHTADAYRQTDTQTVVTNIHFASAMPDAKCKNTVNLG